MLQSRQRAPSWSGTRAETNMDVTNAQQWLAGLPPHFVLPKNQRVLPHYFPPQLAPRHFETRAVMNSADWNVRPQHAHPHRADFNRVQGVFKFEGDVAFNDANPLGDAGVSNLFPSGSQQNSWTVESSQLASQPIADTLPSNGQANGLSNRWPTRQSSITSQSSRASHQSNATHFRTRTWPLPLTESSSFDALQPSTAASGFTEPNLNQYSVTVVPSMMTSSFSSTADQAFDASTTNNLSCASATRAHSPIVAPQTLHDGSWDFFDPMNQYPDISSQSFGPAQPSWDPNFSRLSSLATAPPQPGAMTQATHLPIQTQVCDSLHDISTNSVSPTWPEWQTYGDSGFSSESESASPISPTVRADARVGFGNHSFCGSLDSSSMPMPALTYSQASPASDWEDISSSYPGEQRHASRAKLSQRSLRSHTQHSGRFAMLPSQTETTAEWGPSLPPPPKDDGYTRVSGKRVKKDDLLVRWKNAGMSYRQIREKGGFTEAESTLRGRFRTLTKCREERVRKPLWTAKDVQLLREGVKMLMAASLYPGTDAAEMDVDEMEIDANKVPWKKVAEYIYNNDGSYHFGNATCKKQWLKIQGMQ
ncbi:hypothetical protein B0J12DRAFT_661138 [Macrophomina phaseolina]|uniref:Myb-like domain-containing protein n=1 Tax=Macrophomina phaseolina TaxID=35725 RepID=A0ABQ8GD69_9PEZI|nr:hypothetical protein B0J12DRAFT_661138 [Macrophomina phaseolina]